MLNIETERLATFKNSEWPLKHVKPIELAEIGFYFYSKPDLVQCYFCRQIVGSWCEDDTALTEHLRWSPNCPLLRRRSTNNIPIDADHLNRILPPLTLDVAGPNMSSISYSSSYYSPMPSSTSSSLPSSPATTSNQTTLRPSSIDRRVNSVSEKSILSNAKHPIYKHVDVRRESFIQSDWSSSGYNASSPNINRLAEAGFFYIGSFGITKCFYCDLTLQNWNKIDDPEYIHHCFRECTFNRMQQLI